MLDLAIRFLKRLFVLAPGLLVAYFASRELYPFFAERSTAAIAILLTYILTAYVLIPGALRLVRLFFRPKHIPLYSTTPDGFASDPVNIGIVGSLDELKTAMKKIGWYVADKHTPYNTFRMVAAIISKRSYRTAPMSSLYLLGRKQDIGFQKPLGSNPSHRHHVRFWAVAKTINPQYHEHVSFWKRHHKQTLKDRYLWIGAASLDTGFGIIRHNAQFTHMIHPDTDAERELIAKSLKKAKRVKRIRAVQLDEPYRLINRVWTGYLHTDGRMLICELTDSKTKS
jgi:hypothetical protein